jgi:anti-anti-sigma factor
MKTVSDDEKKDFLMEDNDVTVTIESILSIPNLKIITIRGIVNRDNSLRVDEKVMPVIEKEESNVILNLSNLDYLTNVGMRCIVKYLVLCTDKKRLFKLVKPPKSAYDNMVYFMVFFGIEELFSIYDSLETAISSF